MRYLIPFIACILIVHGFNGCSEGSSSTASVNDPKQDYQAALEEILANESGKGISAAVILPDGTEWRGCAGYSSLGCPITPDMLFDMGSAGKNLFAALMLKLEEENVLSLDDPVGQYIPQMPNVNPDVTLRQCLNHTNGMYMIRENPDSPYQSPYDQIEFERWWSMTEIFDELMHDPYFEPGSGWHFTHAGYHLSSIIVELLTFNSPANVIQEKLLNPLNIDGMLLNLQEPLPTSCRVAHQWVDFDSDGSLDDVSGYSRNWINSLSRLLYYSTPEALAKWLHSLMNGDVLSGESMSSMLQFYSPCPGEEMTAGYGLGTSQYFIDGIEAWGHTGSIPGYRTLALYFPDSGSTVVMMINWDTDTALNELIRPLMRSVLDEPNSESMGVTQGYDSM